MRLFKISFMFIFLFLTACEDTILLQDLDQKNANDVLVMLSKNGVPAKREAITKQQATSWTIKISPNDENRARELLVLNNLPRQKEMGLSGICKDAGLIPTPKTEKCREMLGMKGEIINSLQSIPGVVSADIVINVPDKEEFPDANTPAQRPTASVVVQVGNWADPEMFNEAKIQQFVANAVTGMDMRDVVVIISRLGIPVAADNTKVEAKDGIDVKPEVTDTTVEEDVDTSDEDGVLVGGLNMDTQSAKKFRVIAAIVLIIFVFLAAGLVFLLFRMVKNRQSTQVMTTALKPVLAEKTDMDHLVDDAVQNQNEGNNR